MDDWAKKWVAEMRRETVDRKRAVEKEEKKRRQWDLIFDRVAQWKAVTDEITAFFHELERDASLSKEQKKFFFFAHFLQLPSCPRVSVAVESLAKVDTIRGFGRHTHIKHSYSHNTMFVFAFPFDRSGQIVSEASNLVSQIKYYANAFTNPISK